MFLLFISFENIWYSVQLSDSRRKMNSEFLKSHVRKFRIFSSWLLHLLLVPTGLHVCSSWSYVIYGAKSKHRTHRAPGKGRGCRLLSDSWTASKFMKSSLQGPPAVSMQGRCMVPAVHGTEPPPGPLSQAGPSSDRAGADPALEMYGHLWNWQKLCKCWA